MASKITQTPLLRQYEEMKRKHPDAVLLFRVGDFYESFHDDAVALSEILGVTLTRRANGNNPIALAGFPHHALDTYLPKLVRAGKRVAICEEIHSPQIQKKLGKRSITELVSPSLPQQPEQPKPSIEAAIHQVKTAAAELPEWGKPNEKWRQLTLDFDF